MLNNVAVKYSECILFLVANSPVARAAQHIRYKINCYNGILLALLAFALQSLPPISEIRGGVLAPYGG